MSHDYTYIHTHTQAFIHTHTTCQTDHTKKERKKKNYEIKNIIKIK